ncbi:hypothetical protein PENPOL_c009G06380 [Penicillium polonicum]|uniref:Uncharacterized protein n=1 Tax=Penicillium polonicum TaxID=60169 RepID=A0A1V6NGD4_PENPO|nr:hypothetical protein PENPOL_c009G06380 [Penicillium polonicum]
METGGPREPDASNHALRSTSSSRLNELSSLQKDTYYIKKGRTTNVTGGMCNGVVAVCNWKTRYDINDNTVDGKDLRTEEFTIIGVQGSFLESGDSDSFVVDSTGAVAGLIFADYKHNFQTVALALPVRYIIDTMKARLKAPVSLRLL